MVRGDNSGALQSLKLPAVAGHTHGLASGDLGERKVLGPSAPAGVGLSVPF